jgi:hypothetical protein
MSAIPSGSAGARSAAGDKSRRAPVLWQGSPYPHLRLGHPFGSSGRPGDCMPKPVCARVIPDTSLRIH